MLEDTCGLAPREKFVSAMRTVASSVTVVTTDGIAGRHGATVSAFSSVSADPPTVLVCLYGQSRIARAVSDNGAFCVNVLSEDSTEIANRFAGRDDAQLSDRFSGIECYGKVGTAPQIDGATIFVCTVQQFVHSGSHLIVIGHVNDVLDGLVPPLTYRAGAYHRVIPKDLPVQAA